MKRLAILILTGFLMVVASNNASAQVKYTFKKGQLVTYKGKPCGSISNKWTPVKKSGKSYVIDRSSKTRCSGLLSPVALKKNGLGKLPKASSLLRARASGASISDPNGTPPLLKNIPSIVGGVKNLFWSDGVIDAIANGTATTQQCSEYFAGSTDGSSAGLVGCFGAQGVGFSFQSVLDGAGSSCYMKNIAKQSLVDSGAVTVIDGSLPSGGIANVFSPPSGSQDRLVKVVIAGFGGGGSQNGFLKIDSTSKLNNAGHQYAFTVYFCEGSSSTPTNKERVTVSTSGQYSYQGIYSQGSFVGQNTISARLASSGSTIRFDPTQNRTSLSNQDLGGGQSFKSSVTITPANLIENKTYDFFGAGGRKVYAISEFSGTDISDFRVIQSAVKQQFSSGSNEGGTEYRGSVGKYVSAPSNGLIGDLEEVNFATDTFFDAPASVNPDYSGLSCTADAAVTLQMDFSNPDLGAIAQECEQEKLEGMNFCIDDSSVAAAMAAYATTCSN